MRRGKLLRRFLDPVRLDRFRRWPNELPAKEKYLARPAGNFLVELFDDEPGNEDEQQGNERGKHGPDSPRVFGEKFHDLKS